MTMGMIKKVTPIDDQQLMREFRAALLKVPCRTCNSAVDEPCGTYREKWVTNPWRWHESRKQDAGVVVVAASKILRALGQSPRRSTR